jgi:hypothetical protein
MLAEATRFQPGEPVIVTRACLGVPALSVGVIAEIYSRDPVLYVINFGTAFRAGPIPERVLSLLQLTDAPG